MTTDLRAHIGALVCVALNRIGYTSCGTVEFLFPDALPERIFEPHTLAKDDWPERD